jgi:YHS domain-containing protein
MRRDYLLGPVLTLGIALVLGGCGNPEEPTTPSEKPAAQTAAAPAAQEGEQGGAGHTGAEGQMKMDMGEKPDAKIAASLAQLSEEDRALAEKQRICPVSGQPLGSMGVPVKVTVKGQDVFLCCEGCKEAIEKDPDTYLAKLNKQ